MDLALRGPLCAEDLEAWTIDRLRFQNLEVRSPMSITGSSRGKEGEGTGEKLECSKILISSRKACSLLSHKSLGSWRFSWWEH